MTKKILTTIILFQISMLVVYGQQNPQSIHQPQSFYYNQFPTQPPDSFTLCNFEHTKLLDYVIANEQTKQKKNDVVYTSYHYKIVHFKHHQLFAKYDTTKIKQTEKFEADSLMSFLLQGIKNNIFKAYSTDYNHYSEFSVENQISYEDIKFKMDAYEQVIDIGNGETENFIKRIDFSELKSIIVKELHFFNKKMQLIDKIVIGICPVRYCDGQNNNICWMYFPQIKDELKKQPEFYNYFTKFQYNAHYYYTDVGYKNNSDTTLYQQYVPVAMQDAKKQAAKYYKKSEFPFNISKKEPKKLIYNKIDTSTVLSTKYIYSTIDLNERCNSYLHHPKMSIGNYKSFSDYLFSFIENGSIKAYSTETKYEFAQEIDFQQIKKDMGADDYKNEVYENGNWVTITIPGYIIPSEIKKYIIIKELQITCKDTIYKYLVGISPVRNYYGIEDFDKQQLQSKQICWIKFEDLKPLLSGKYIYDVWNERIGDVTYDEFFYHRLFCAEPLIEKDSYFSYLLHKEIEEEKVKELPVPKSYAINQLNTLIRASAKTNSKTENNKDNHITYIRSSIELSIEQNQPLYYPIEPIEYLNYYNLMELIYRNYKTGKLKGYDINENFEETPLDKDAVAEKLEAMPQEIAMIGLDGEMIIEVVENEPLISEIVKYEVIKKVEGGRSEIYALCPVRVIYEIDEVLLDKPRYKKIGWFKFSDLEDILKSYYIYKLPNSTGPDKTFYNFFIDEDYIDIEYFRKIVEK